ncbi:hypothetical protein [Wolbachia endosymbiont of Oedothorax gibbosus]|uniref:hypothetical protein n=1 Tax=Wolbachia endosymbiont of Oedothorax gibbosus TaxID=931100 RepID=UPI0020250A12|nr:hypothetical protein [Wolbachia endosymbiont of Oedothorax gibbosus]
MKMWSKFWKMPFTNISFLGVSDSEEVVEEIKKYFKLYGEIEEIAQEVSQVVEQEGINAAEPQINALRVKLQEAIKEAKDEKECVSSSAVFNAHMGLISEQEKVIGKLTSIQLGVSQERGFSLTKKLEKSEDLSEGYRRQFDTVREENQEIKQQIATLTRQMQRMMQNQAPSSSLSEVDPISRSSSIGSDIEFVGRK